MIFSELHELYLIFLYMLKHFIKAKIYAKMQIIMFLLFLSVTMASYAYEGHHE